MESAESELVERSCSIEVGIHLQTIASAAIIRLISAVVYEVTVSRLLSMQPM
jgi:hypothetical protein